MEMFQEWLSHLPPFAIALVVLLVIGLESMGIPLPGELILVSGALLAATAPFSPWWVASGAAIGAIVGDSIGYYVGHRGGRTLLERLGRRFPKHLGPAHLARAERTFARWGAWAVFFGRFVALLRILAGPLSGALRVPYRKFLLANAAGGIVWAFGTTFTIYFLGRAAERYFKDFSWVALGVAVVFGLASTWYLKRRAAHRAEHPEDDDEAEIDTVTEGTVEAGTVAASVATAATDSLLDRAAESEAGFVTGARSGTGDERGHGPAGRHGHR